jgi:hypothetical protein
MSVWTPEYKVEVDGVEVTDITLVGFSITSGRTDINTQAQASYANIRMLNTTGAIYNWTINTSVKVEVKNSDNVYITIFKGNISDLTIGVESASSVALVTTIEMYALGSLARIQNALWSGALSIDTDGEQIRQILEPLLLNTWNQLNPSVTWENYDTTETWENAANSGLGTIDPGRFNMVSRDANPINSYSIISDIANSGLGFLYEDSNGFISYGDVDRRQDDVINNGYISLDAQTALYEGIRATTRQGDICNDLVFTYGIGGAQSYEYKDNNSKATFGLFARSISSRVEDTGDAEQIAERFVLLRAQPKPKFDSITFALQNPEITDQERDNLIEIFMGMPVLISNLPLNINGGEFNGYVEGWTFRSSLSGLIITFTVSPSEFSSFTRTWAQTNPDLIWSDVNDIIDWENAIGDLT